MTGRRTIGLLAATHVAALGVGYVVAPKEILDEEAKQSGFFQVDTAKVLSTTVESLKKENSLVVWSYKGTATVRARRERLWVLEANQTLIVPYAIDYRLNLADLTLDKIDYNEKAKIVTVHLPKLQISDVAFAPEQATTVNGGLLSFSDDAVQALGKFAYQHARKAVIKQAQQNSMVDLAKRQARDNIKAYFEIPLRIAGMPDVEVAATFD